MQQPDTWRWEWEEKPHITLQYVGFFYLFYMGILRFFTCLHGHPAIFNLFSQSFRQKLSVYGKGTLLCDHGNRTIYILLDLDVLYPPLRAHLEVCDI